VVLLEGSGFHFGRPGWPVRLGADAPTAIGGPPRTAAPPAPTGQRGLPGPQLHLPVQVGEKPSPRVVFWSTAGFPKVTAGIGAVEPLAYKRMEADMAGFPDRRSVARLRALRIRVVVLHPDLVPGTAWANAARRPLNGLPLTRRGGGGVVVYWVH
jgi:hypothetical protein